MTQRTIRTPHGVLSTVWSEQDMESLRALWPSASRAEIEAALPGRTWGALRSKASKNGISRDRSLAGAEARATRPRPPHVLMNERRIFDYVRDHTDRLGFGPILIDVAEGTGLHTTTVRNAVDRMIRRGLLVQNKGRGRMIGIHPKIRARLAQRAA